ncbi:hemoglobin-haptoglobin-utilization protein A [Neisseria brasiliensis]|uniref:transferrin-binding protein-like solute binding protein n=1 Tax=Neisseria TaxID=482 RepID=UPI000C26FAC5|nr:MULTISPECIES: transferrin-binding protein-like solute binding protein [Neisseria]PJO77101.1 hemoglobin-haptoglobin-utilization protein A [Neisseria sp. N177_16]QGL24746.1 hemoglobin-haptoglobin-utilization protein A [Neisseria brasiliensis]
MTILFFRRPAIALAVAASLSACAGGGSVSEPKVLVEMPVLKSLDTKSDKVKARKDDAEFETIATNGGSVHKYNVTEKVKSSRSDSYYDKTDEVVVYTTADGKSYQFNQFNTAMRPDYSSPSKTYPTKQVMQPTEDGGKIFACCTNSRVDQPATYVKSSYFGAWMDKNGVVSLFSGGILADKDYMQGGAKAKGVKGEATYDVIGYRVKNGEIVSSSYTPKDSSKEQVSRLTVNFNTGELGGTIIGNSDFGDSVTFDKVSVEGNKFHGTAKSGEVSGKVNGAFYGKVYKGYYGDTIREYAGKEIGGTVNFDNKNLDTVFGGSRTKVDTTTDSKDLSPVVGK